MKTKAGLIELDCGWIIAVAPIGYGKVRLLFQFNPERELFENGVKDLHLSDIEGRELLEALASALRRSRLDTAVAGARDAQSRGRVE